MATRQFVGETKTLTFDFSPGLLTDEVIDAGEVVAVQLAGDPAEVSAVAVASSGTAISCLVATPNAGVTAVVATATCVFQTLKLKAQIDAVGITA